MTECFSRVTEPPFPMDIIIIPFLSTRGTPYSLPLLINYWCNFSSFDGIRNWSFLLLTRDDRLRVTLRKPHPSPLQVLIRVKTTLRLVLNVLWGEKDSKTKNKTFCLLCSNADPYTKNNSPCSITRTIQTGIIVNAICGLKRGSYLAATPAFSYKTNQIIKSHKKGHTK